MSYAVSVTVKISDSKLFCYCQAVTDGVGSVTVAGRGRNWGVARLWWYCHGIRCSGKPVCVLQVLPFGDDWQLCASESIAVVKIGVLYFKRVGDWAAV